MKQKYNQEFVESLITQEENQQYLANGRIQHLAVYRFFGLLAPLVAGNGSYVHQSPIALTKLEKLKADIEQNFNNSAWTAADAVEAAGLSREQKNFILPAVTEAVSRLYGAYLDDLDPTLNDEDRDCLHRSQSDIAEDMYDEAVAAAS